MIHNKFILWAATALLTLATACTESDMIKEEMLQESGKPHTYRLRIDMSVPSHDGQTTRANTEWEDGSKVEFKFYTDISEERGGSGLAAKTIFYHSISGYATYSSAKNEWLLETEEAIPSDRTMTDCEVRYYQPQNGYDNDFMTSVYYGTTTYLLDGDQILCSSISLKPTNWRLRFKGEKGTQIELISDALEHSDGESLHMDEDPFALIGDFQTIDTLPLTVASDGYTPYIYGTFKNEEGDNTITVETGGQKYTRTINGTALQPGETGYIVIPTEDNYEAEGWTREIIKNLSIPINSDISINMVYVEAGEFSMGATEEQGVEGVYPNESPVHKVLLTNDYYISETEVTQALWYAVMGQKPTTDGDKWNNDFGLGDNRPAYYVNWDDCQTFITKLNQLTGKKFRLPTEAEWEYAARGGNKSEQYKFAGSNTIDEVAWYTANSNNSTHEVAQKKPNELGLYDMSGNVWEWCLDAAYSYDESPVVDPMHGAFKNTCRMVRGGKWSSGESGCRLSNRDHDKLSTLRSPYLGMRLVIGNLPMENLEVSPDRLTFNSLDHDRQIVTVTSNTDWDFEVKEGSDWCEVRDSNNTIIVTVKESTSPRTATITVKVGTVTKEVRVTQKGKSVSDIDVTPFDDDENWD